MTLKEDKIAIKKLLTKYDNLAGFVLLSVLGEIIGLPDGDCTVKINGKNIWDYPEYQKVKAELHERQNKAADLTKDFLANIIGKYK